MKTIWKFPVTGFGIQHISIPEKHKIIHVDNQNESMCFWAEVDTSTPNVLLPVTIVGTGGTPPSGFEHIGTAIIKPFVWHLYKGV